MILLDTPFARADTRNTNHHSSTARCCHDKRANPNSVGRDYRRHSEGMSWQGRDLIWELFHFAQDASRGRDEAIAANRALEELMGERQQQLAASKLRVEQLEVNLANATGERKVMRKQLRDRDLTIKQLEANLEKARRDAQAMRDKLDEWVQALNRTELMAESVKGFGGVHESK